jgi:GH18 family chitinase
MIFNSKFLSTADRQVQPNKDYKVVCYYSSWAWLRRADAEFVPENVLSSSCTHVLYAYAGLDPKTLLIKSNDIWTDISNSKQKTINSFISTLKINKIVCLKINRNVRQNQRIERNKS